MDEPRGEAQRRVSLATGSSGRRRIPSLRDEAAEEIRSRVFSARLRPGERIDQERFARDLGISRVPVREALITLHDEGIVVNVARRGAFVAPLSRADVHDHYRLIGLVSGLMAERAAANLDEGDLLGLRALMSEMERHPTPREEEQLNYEFHRRINRSAGSRRLASVLSTLVNAIPRTFYESHEQWADLANSDHRVIADALEARDGSAARDATEGHFAAAADRMVTFLESRQFWDEVTQHPSAAASGEPPQRW